ncbi:nitric oxide reductase transcriptional regulator NorR [Carnimonas nigrificans]|uniref:nitric oxide reductase transcriptional regulator NorR n=1 Tax=Carnimonas nigrificans TaxID=64323 RepID=UPI000472315E|nr:nitric oxide reductase transcriptional regulator NorR [Carnimonas nigrificans]
MISVNRTQHQQLLRQLTPLFTDLSREMPLRTRYQRLLDVLKQVIPCEAAALLKLDGGTLQPVAVDGLGKDTLGRRFEIAHHPRLEHIIRADGAYLFPPDCPLPDPYDGLIEMNQGLVHDCMGCAIYIDETLWGAMTMDSLTVGSFSASDLPVLEAFASLAAASISTALHFDAIRHRAEDQQRRAEAYRLQAYDAAGPVLDGQSHAFRELQKKIDLVAASEMPVLITGESGVGKELVARALHARSARADQPLVSLNCAALSENLIESELFGHVRGAFSGATQDRPGKFQMANNGTLLLDEIGELPLSAQAKLLRVLQEGELQRVGSDRDHRVDVRILAATNRELEEEVKAGRFRMDLYHRLSVFPLHVPALRERCDDILPLAGTFAEENRSRMALRSLRFSPEAQQALMAYAWPGNVRELEHSIARAALMARSHADDSGVVTITPPDLGLLKSSAEVDSPASRESAPQETLGLRDAVDDFQRHQISLAITRANGNISAAARALAMDRANLVRLAGRLGLALPTRKSRSESQPG